MVDISKPETTPLFQTSPERIGLAVSDDMEDWHVEFSAAHDSATWYSGEDPLRVCVHYVRADLYESLQTQLAAANEQIRRLWPAKLSAAPCSICGYNGPGYYQAETHPCAAQKADAAAPVPAQPAFLAQDPTGRLSVLMREAAARESVPAQPAVVPEWQLRTPADQRMVDLVRHLATYPVTRADELMAADMRKMCRDAVSIYDAAILSTTDTEVNNGPA